MKKELTTREKTIAVLKLARKKRLVQEGGWLVFNKVDPDLSVADREGIAHYMVDTIGVARHPQIGKDECSVFVIPHKFEDFWDGITRSKKNEAERRWQFWILFIVSALSLLVGALR